jgi:hypothetical protein
MPLSSAFWEIGSRDILTEGLGPRAERPIQGPSVAPKNKAITPTKPMANSTAPAAESIIAEESAAIGEASP